MKKTLFIIVIPILVIGVLYQYLHKKIPSYAGIFNSSKTHFDFAKVPPAPDYNSKENWMLIPENPKEFEVDVFWVYPTIYNSKESTNMPLNDESAKERAKNASFKFAGVFRESANVYAPYYRQAGGYMLSANESDKGKALGVSTGDIKDAFNYYLTNFNNGKPFIIAGHSQGAMVLLNIMKDLFLSDPVREKLVAAYLIGWTVTKEDLNNYPFLKIAKTPEETGVIITYNTVADGFQDKTPTILSGAVVVNPLTWTTSEEIAPATLNKGAVFFDKDLHETIIPNYISAQIKNGGLVVPRIANEDQLEMPFGPGVYHNYDYLFFFENIRENVKERIKTFLTKNKKPF
jgi:hypothetical protein